MYVSACFMYGFHHVFTTFPLCHSAPGSMRTWPPKLARSQQVAPVATSNLRASFCDVDLGVLVRRFSTSKFSNKTTRKFEVGKKLKNHQNIWMRFMRISIQSEQPKFLRARNPDIHFHARLFFGVFRLPGESHGVR